MTEWTVKTTQNLYSGSQLLRRTIMLNKFQIISFDPQSIIMEFKISWKSIIESLVLDARSKLNCAVHKTNKIFYFYSRHQTSIKVSMVWNVDRLDFYGFARFSLDTSYVFNAGISLLQSPFITIATINGVWFRCFCPIKIYRALPGFECPTPGTWTSTLPLRYPAV